MKVVFAGTPEFAQQALQRLLQAGFEVPLVLTQPDRPAGRGMKLQASPVKQTALAHGIPVQQPHGLKLDGKHADEAAQARAALLQAQPDVMVVAAYGLILPQWVLDLPRLGCLNIHASLLPRWRGAAPIHRAIESGDAETGVTIMQMDIGLDTGDMLLTERLPITAAATTASLHDQLADLGGRLIVEALELAACGGLPPATPQPADGITYAHKIEKAEARINWQDSADQIARRVRAFTPFPIAHTTAPNAEGQHELVKVHAAQLLEQDSQATPGQVLASGADGIDVACRDGRVLRLTMLQRAGGKRLPVAYWLRGFALPAGTVLGQQAD